MGKILFVDNMPGVYDKIRFLENTDYVNTFDSARHMLYSKRYDLLITDYHLGKEDPTGGIELIKIAKSIGIEAVLISSQNKKKEALDAGAVKFIFKKDFIDGICRRLNPIQLINLSD